MHEQDSDVDAKFRLDLLTAAPVKGCHFASGYETNLDFQILPMQAGCNIETTGDEKCPRWDGPNERLRKNVLRC